MSEEEICVVLNKVGARFFGVQQVGPPEFVEDQSLVLFSHDCLPRRVVTAIRVSECNEMQLLLHLAHAARRWKPLAEAFPVERREEVA
jgi:hypothetical protein